MASNVIFDEPYTLGMADYGKFVKVDRSYVETLGYPVSGHGKYALLTYGVNDATTSRTAVEPAQTNAVAVGEGEAVDVSAYHNYTVHILASAVSTGATVEVQHSLDGTNYATVSTSTISSDGVTEVAISQHAYIYLRTAITSWTDGDYSTIIYAGN